MLELLQRVNWDEYVLVLSQGNPPIGLQLLLVNAMIVAYWLLRRTKRKSRQGAGWMLPVLFIAGNIGVVTWGSRLSF
jgi:hypothetical protein